MEIQTVEYASEQFDGSYKYYTVRYAIEYTIDGFTKHEVLAIKDDEGVDKTFDMEDYEMGDIDAYLQTLY